MIKLKPYSSIVLSLAGIILSVIGLYFIFIRPSLLPEDLRYMASSLQNVNEHMPGLANWLQKVFYVLGSFIVTTGVLTIFIAPTSFRKRLPGTAIIVAFAGITSIGLMTVVNFMIGSDFRWVLLAFTLPWIIALILYRFHK